MTRKSTMAANGFRLAAITSSIFPAASQKTVKRSHDESEKKKKKERAVANQQRNKKRNPSIDEDHTEETAPAELCENDELSTGGISQKEMETLEYYESNRLMELEKQLEAIEQKAEFDLQNIKDWKIRNKWKLKRQRMYKEQERQHEKFRARNRSNMKTHTNFLIQHLEQDQQTLLDEKRLLENEMDRLSFQNKQLRKGSKQRNVVAKKIEQQIIDGHKNNETILEFDRQARMLQEACRHEKNMDEINNRLKQVYQKAFDDIIELLECRCSDSKLLFEVILLASRNEAMNKKTRGFMNGSSGDNDSKNEFSDNDEDYECLDATSKRQESVSSQTKAQSEVVSIAPSAPQQCFVECNNDETRTETKKCRTDGCGEEMQNRGDYVNKNTNYCCDEEQFIYLDLDVALCNKQECPSCTTSTTVDVASMGTTLEATSMATKFQQPLVDRSCDVISDHELKYYDLFVSIHSYSEELSESSEDSSFECEDDNSILSINPIVKVDPYKRSSNNSKPQGTEETISPCYCSKDDCYQEDDLTASAAAIRLDVRATAATEELRTILKNINDDLSEGGSLRMQTQSLLIKNSSEHDFDSNHSNDYNLFNSIHSFTEDLSCSSNESFGSDDEDDNSYSIYSHNPVVKVDPYKRATGLH